MTKDHLELALKAGNLARNYEKANTGCAQSTVAGILDALEISGDEVFKSASGLADGLGLSGNCTCGALMGGALVISFLFGRERKDFSDPLAGMKAYELSKVLHDEFMEKYKTCRCNDIQESLMGRHFNLWDDGEFEKAIEADMLTHCSKLVGSVAEMTMKLIMKEKGEG